jgi:hypothetical protein
MAPQVAIENSIESLQKLLEALQGAIQHAEHDFDTLEHKPDMEEALGELSTKVESLNDAARHKFVEELPKTADDLATELGQLELVAQGAVKEMDSLEQLLESADIDLITAVEQIDTSLQEGYTAFTQAHEVLAQHLQQSVAAAAESHEHATSETTRFRDVLDDGNAEALVTFQQTEETLEQAGQFVDQTLDASIDNTMQTFITTLDTTIRNEIETTLDTFEDRVPDDVAWLIKVEEHMGGLAGGCIEPMNLLSRHCTEEVGPGLEKQFDTVSKEAVPELANELIQDLALVSVALAAGEGLQPLLPELAAADKTLEEFNAEVEKISADAP